ELCQGRVPVLQEGRVENLVVGWRLQFRQLGLHGPLTLERASDGANVVRSAIARQSGPDDEFVLLVTSADRVGLLGERVPRSLAFHDWAKRGADIVEGSSKGVQLRAEVVRAPGCDRRHK